MIRKRSQNDRRIIPTEKYAGHPLPETIQECESDENVDEIASSTYSRTDVSQTVSPDPRLSTSSSLAQNQKVQLAYSGVGNRGQRVTGGSATERSSVYSFGDDEFDRETSLSVQKLFDDVDLILFERSSTGPTQLRSECDDWICVFPHLRVVGRTKVPVHEFGYKFFECKEDSELTPRNEEDLNSCQELVAKGTCIRMHRFNGTEHFAEPHSHVSEADFEFLESNGLEEVFVQEGLVEEVLAIDRTSFGDQSNGCLQREVLQNLFNETWADVINGLEELLSKRVLHCFSQCYSHSVPVLLDRFHHDAAYPSSHDTFLTRESTTVSSTTRQTAPDRITRQFSNMSSLNTKLEEVLKISSKALQIRDRNFSHDLPDCPVTPLTRPSSSGHLPVSGRPYNPRMVNEYVPSSRSRLVAGKGKLNPISSHDQLRVFTTEDEKQLDLSHEVIRGYRINNSNGRSALASSSSPPSTMSTLRPPTRPLPPITRDNRSAAGHNNIFPRKPMLRVRSAVPNKAGLQSHDRADRAWPSGDHSRPNRIVLTTAAVTDHAHGLYGVNKRSSTTLGFNSLQSQPADSVGGVLVKGHRKLSVVGNQIPEYDPEGDDDGLSDVVRISSNFSFGRRAGQRDQHFGQTAIR